MTGVELLKRAKKQWPDTIRIMLTGYTDIQTQMATTEVGVYGFLLKPWNGDDLRMTVEQALHRWDLTSENRTLHALIRKQDADLKLWNERFEEKVRARTEQLEEKVKELERRLNGCPCKGCGIDQAREPIEKRNQLGRNVHSETEPQPNNATADWAGSVSHCFGLCLWLCRAMFPLFSGKAMNVQKAKNLIDGISDLPSLPFVVSKMLEVTADSKAAAPDLGQVISMDQTLTAKVLRLVNSSFYGFRGQVSTISHAVVMLGFNVIRSLTLGLSVVKIMGNLGNSKGFNYEGFWEHSAGCAVCARWLAKRTNYDPPEEAMVAGMMHDIGKILLSEYAAGGFEKAVRIASEEGKLLAKAEEQVFGFNHALVGMLLAKGWNLPALLCEGIRFHHEAFSDKGSPHSEIAYLVHMSNLYCKEQRIGFGGDRNLPEDLEPLWRELGLNKQDRTDLSPQLKGEVRQAETLFGIRR